MIPVLELSAKVPTDTVTVQYGWFKNLWSDPVTGTKRVGVHILDVVCIFILTLNLCIHNAYSAQDQYGVNKAVANIAAGFIPQAVTSQRAFS